MIAPTEVQGHLQALFEERYHWIHELLEKTELKR